MICPCSLIHIDLFKPLRDTFSMIRKKWTLHILLPAIVPLLLSWPLLLSQPRPSRLPSCKIGQHFPGVWEKLSDDSHQVGLGWPCCGWDNRDWERFKDCGNATSGVEGISGNGPAFTPNDSYAKVGGHGCSCDANMISARWVPKHCELKSWDKVTFCTLLRNRKMLFIGDSTMQQTAATVMNAVYGNCHRSMAFGISDTLVGRSFGAMNRGKSWSVWVQEFNPDIVVLSTGAHIHNFTDFSSLLHEVYGNFSLFANSTFIWKTQNPGGCDNKMQSELNNEFWQNYSGHGDVKRFGWDEFLDRDVHAIQFFSRTPVPILDVRPLYMRTDAHPGSYPDTATYRDCLHFCCHSKGPLHLIPILLHHTLMEFDHLNA